ncbi:MAG: hypothetical protein Q8S57_03015 [Methanoregula sp.]|nr:hypothetical protein [Methanoregula sp.]
MNFGSLGCMGGAVGSYLSTPEGQEAAKKYLASPDGIAMLKGFIATPEGKKTILNVLPALLDGINLPPTFKEAVISAISTSV